MARRKPKVNALYFTQKLNMSLAGILNCPFTIVEAPMGYGKTTAVREFLKRQRLQTLWLTVSGEGYGDFWQGICQLLAKRFPKQQGLVHHIMSLGFPSDIIRIEETVRLFGRLQLKDKTVLVIDNFHLINNEAIARFIEYLVYEGVEDFHIILLTRSTFCGNWQTLALKNMVHIIDMGSLRLECEEIQGYFRQCGIELAEENLEPLYTYTEGWFSGVYLYLLYYVKHQRFPWEMSLHDLVQEAIYADYSRELRLFFCSIALPGHLTPSQIQFFWPGQNARRELKQLCSENTFIAFDEASEHFSLHPIFRNFLLEEFEKLPDDVQRTIWAKTGAWYEQADSYWQAACFFFRAQQPEKSLQMICVDKGGSINQENWPCLRLFFSGCSQELRQQYLPAVFVYALSALKFNDLDVYEQEIRWLETAIGNLPDAHSEKLSLLGELELLRSFGVFDDCQAMSKHVQSAKNYMHAPSRIFDSRSSWSQTMPSVLLAFHRRSGRLEEEIDLVCKAIPIYNELTHGFGSGLEILMKAEALFYRGDMIEAEHLVSRAEVQAKRKSQYTTMVSAMFLRARISLYRGNLDEAERLLQATREMDFSHETYAFLHGSEIIQAWIYGNLGQYDMIPDWIRRGQLKESGLLPSSHIAYYVTHYRALLLNDEYQRLIHSAEQLLSDSHFQHFAALRTYCCVYLAAATYRLRQFDRALAYMRLALETAAADCLYIPFVMTNESSRPLLDLLAAEHRYEEANHAIHAMIGHWQTVKKTMMQNQGHAARFELLVWEEEIAYLASRGYRISAIADQLALSPIVVRTSLEAIYTKLGVNDRAALFRRLNETK